MQRKLLQAVMMRRTGLEPVPGCPEGILRPPLYRCSTTTYALSIEQPALGLWRLGAVGGGSSATNPATSATEGGRCLL